MSESGKMGTPTDSALTGMRTTFITSSTLDIMWQERSMAKVKCNTRTETRMNVSGVNHGWGAKLRYANDATFKEYTGQFHWDYFHGHGTMYYVNGDTYIGAWKNGCLNNGELRFAKGTNTAKEQ